MTPYLRLSSWKESWRICYTGQHGNQYYSDCMNKRQWMEGSQQTSFHEHGCEDGTMREDGMDRPHIVLHVWLQITISSACFHKHKFEDGTMRKDGMVQQHIVLHLWLQIR